MFSKLPAIGSKTKIENNPTKNATIEGGNRLCIADCPAARLTTNSEVLDRLRANESPLNITINGKSTEAGKVGIVFQSFALFDELTPRQNVDYAKASGGAHGSKLTSEQLLEKLEVPAGVPTSRLSGGQQFLMVEYP